MTRALLPTRAFAIEPRTGQPTRQGYEYLDQFTRSLFVTDETAAEARATLGLATTDDVTFNSVTSSGSVVFANRLQPASFFLADNTATEIDFGEDIFGGILRVITNNSNAGSAFFDIRMASGPRLHQLTERITGGTNFFTTTTGTTFTGSDGTDVRCNLSANTSGVLSLENRLGATTQYWVILEG